MTSIVPLVIFVAFFLVLWWALGEDKIHRDLHTKGRMDVIRHKDDSDKYTGLQLWSYSRGRTVQQKLEGEK